MSDLADSLAVKYPIEILKNGNSSCHLGWLDQRICDGVVHKTGTVENRCFNHKFYSGNR